VAKLGYPVLGGKNIIAAPSTKTAKFEVKNRCKFGGCDNFYTFSKNAFSVYIWS